MRLCFLGNSHIACVRQAYSDDASRWSWLDATFVGAHKGLLLETAERDRRLVPTSPEARDAFESLGGLSTIDLDAYDAFVITGCLISFAPIAQIHKGARWLGLPSLEASDDFVSEKPVLMSEGAVERIAVDLLFKRLGCRLVRHLSAMTDRPILLTSQPRISAVISQGQWPATYTHKSILRKGDTAPMSDLFDRAAAEAVAGSGGVFLPQPIQTRDKDILTKRSFMDGAIRLTSKGRVPQPQQDYAHANLQYGAAVLDQITEVLDAA